MRFIEWLFRRIHCLMEGHRYIIEFYNNQGEVSANKCLHCHKVKQCKTTS